MVSRFSHILSISIAIIALKVPCFASWYEGYTPWAGAIYTKPTLLADLKYENNNSNTDSKRIEFILRENVKIKGTRALFSDLIDCVGDEAICANLDIIDVGINLEKKNKKIMTRNRINGLLEKQKIVVPFILTGADRVIVSRQRYFVSGFDVKRFLSSQLARELKFGDDFRVDFRISGIKKKYINYTKAWKIIIENMNELKRNLTSDSNLFTQKLLWRFDTEVGRINTAFVKPHILRKVLVFSNKSNKGTKVSPEQLEFSWIRESEIPRNYFNPQNQDYNYILVRDVKRGQVVSSEYLEIPYLIKRGDRVEVISTSKGLSISMSGEALNNGHVGETVTVKLKGTKKSKRLVGKVRSAGVVEVL